MYSGLFFLVAAFWQSLQNDWRITKPDYDKKLQEIMDRIQMLAIELEEHSKADHDYKTTVGTVLSVARRSREIFDGAELPEKRQFINFLVQTPKLKDRELVFELKKPMNTVLELAQYSASKRKTIGISTDRPSWLRILDGFRTVNYENVTPLLTQFAAFAS